MSKDEARNTVVFFTTPDSYLIRPNDEHTYWIMEQTGDFYHNGGSPQAPPLLPELDAISQQVTSKMADDMPTDGQFFACLMMRFC